MDELAERILRRNAHGPTLSGERFSCFGQMVTGVIAVALFSLFALHPSLGTAYDDASLCLGFAPWRCLLRVACGVCGFLFGPMPNTEPLTISASAALMLRREPRRTRPIFLICCEGRGGAGGPGGGLSDAPQPSGSRGSFVYVHVLARKS